MLKISVGMLLYLISCNGCIEGCIDGICLFGDWGIGEISGIDWSCWVGKLVENLLVKLEVNGCDLEIKIINCFIVMFL